jgi:hypothetical protein
MKRWISIPNPVTLKNPYRTWGQSFLTNIRLARYGYQYYVASRRRTNYERIIASNSLLLSTRFGPSTNPYYDPELMAHLRKYLNFQGFKTRFDTYLVGHWNPIYGELDFTAGTVVVIEQTLYERDRLLQVFRACPEGSYGYYAYYGLSPIKLLVQSFAAAEIDKFFASLAQFIREPFGADIDNMMTALETMYWISRENWVDYAAGQIIGQEGRSAPVAAASRVLTWVEGQRSGSSALTSDQWNEIRDVLNVIVKQVDGDVAKARFDDKIVTQIKKKLGEMYDTAQKENRLKKTPD